MLHAVLILLAVGVSAENFQNGGSALRRDSNPTYANRQIRYPSPYGRMSGYRAYGDYLLPPGMFPYQQRPRTSIKSPEPNAGHVRRQQYDGQDIPNPNYLRDAYPGRSDETYQTQGRPGYGIPLQYQPRESGVPSRGDGGDYQGAPKRPVYQGPPEYVQYQGNYQNFEQAPRRYAPGSDRRDEQGMYSMNGGRTGSTGNDNRNPTGDSLQSGGRHEKVQDNIDFATLLRKNGLSPQNTQKLDFKSLETLLGQNKAFDGKSFKPSDVDLAALYSQDSNSHQRAELSKPKDGRINYGSADGFQRGGQPGYPPRNTGQPIYQPRNTGQPIYPPRNTGQTVYPPRSSGQTGYPPRSSEQSGYPRRYRGQSGYPPINTGQPGYPQRSSEHQGYPPRKTVQPGYPPRSSGNPNYYPRSTDQSRYTPTNTGYPGYPPRSTGLPRYQPRRPQMSYPGTGSPRSPPYYFESQRAPIRPTLYPQQGSGAQNQQRPSPGGSINGDVSANLQNGIPLTAEQIRSLFGSGAGKAPAGDGGDIRGQGGAAVTTEQVENMSGQSGESGTSKQEQDGSGQGTGDTPALPPAGRSNEQNSDGTTGSGNVQVPADGQPMILTQEQFQQIFGQSQSQDPRRDNPSRQENQGEGDQGLMQPRGGRPENQYQSYRGVGYFQYPPYSGERSSPQYPPSSSDGNRNQNLPARAGGYNQYQPVRDDSYNQYQPVRNDGNSQYQPDKGDGRNQYQPVRDDSYNQYQAVRNGGNSQYQPDKGDGRNQYQPVRDDSYNQHQPARGGGYNQYQPVRDDSYNQYQPVRNGGNSQYQPVIGGAHNQYQPVRNGGYNQYQPVGGRSQPTRDDARSNTAGGMQSH